MKMMEISDDIDNFRKTKLSRKIIAPIKAFEDYLVADCKASKTLGSYLGDVK